MCPEKNCEEPRKEFGPEVSQVCSDILRILQNRVGCCETRGAILDVRVGVHWRLQAHLGQLDFSMYVGGKPGNPTSSYMKKY